MKQAEVVEMLCGKNLKVRKEQAMEFSPANIALCKYWGKRDIELNLPFNSSLSISLANKGVTTKISLLEHEKADQVMLNGNLVSVETQFAKRIVEFLNLFRSENKTYFLVDTTSNIPIAAGLASSAAGFAALTKVLSQMFVWQLSETNLSILARLGSGSACRSLWAGFVKWHAGEKKDGMDSFAELIPVKWPELRLGLLVLSNKPKEISSRKAMKQTVDTSCYYKSWVGKAVVDIKVLEKAIIDHDFEALGETAEANALAMHASMLAAWPPVLYWQSKTVAMIQKIWHVRKEGLAVYFTQDAGPNLKLLFLQKDEEEIKRLFPEVEIITPFEEEKDGRADNFS